MQMHGHLPQVPPGDAHGLRRMVLYQEPLEIPHFRDEAPVHTVEILLSLAFKAALAIALGIAPLAMLVFEILLSSFALVTHANLALPARLDRVVRWLLVTPTMHRIHHSVHGAEQRSNYGFNLSLWDHAFRSYSADHRDPVLRIGVAGVGGERTRRFLALLREPFARRD